MKNSQTLGGYADPMHAGGPLWRQPQLQQKGHPLSWLLMHREVFVRRPLFGSSKWAISTSAKC